MLALLFAGALIGPPIDPPLMPPVVSVGGGGGSSSSVGQGLYFFGPKKVKAEKVVAEVDREPEQAKQAEPPAKIKEDPPKAVKSFGALTQLFQRQQLEAFRLAAAQRAEQDRIEAELQAEVDMQMEAQRMFALQRFNDEQAALVLLLL